MRLPDHFSFYVSFTPLDFGWEQGLETWLNIFTVTIGDKSRSLFGFYHGGKGWGNTEIYFLFLVFGGTK